MTDGLVAQLLPWFAIVLLALVAALALTLLTARSLFMVCVLSAALSGLAAVALLALGRGEAAIALALVGAGVAPILLMGGVLLSARTVKPRRRGAPWLSTLAAALAAAAVLWAAPDIAASPPIAAAPGGAGLALAALIFVAIAGCAAMLGYGERGVLESAPEDRS
jgi:uncharacterized MnhB-related membrane protein